jgi:branched-chain amino acid transport system substrate-binding protein
MKKVKLMSLCLAIGFFLLSTALTNAQDLRGITSDSVKVGIITDTTGVVADYGRHLLMGVSDYLKYINEKGGIHGRKINLIHEDDQYKIPLAIASFEKLVTKDEVLAILHCGGTPQTMALLPKIEKEKVPVIPPGMLLPMYTPYKRYVFSYGSTYSNQIEVLIDYVINDLKVKAPKTAIVYWPVEWAKEGLRASKDRLKAYGVDPVGEIELPMGAVDASSQVLSMKRAGAEYVIIFTLAPGIINFIKTAEKFDYFPTYLTFTWCADDSILKAVGKAAKIYYAGSMFGVWNDDSPGGKELREIAQKYGSSPKLPTLYIQGYTTAAILVEGLRRAGKNVTVEKFVDALETLKDFDCGGMLSPMTYTPTIHKPSDYSKIVMADTEKLVFVPVTKWVKPRVIK